MKICMLGSGALGSALGGVLTEGGNDVWLIDAWADHVDAMNSRGLTLRDGGVDRTVTVRARDLRRTASARPISSSCW